uniref:Uncharacterized protein n=1 Tax=Fagus sylvatica TaxID=28930 RepID=A0A2N9FBZ1_FAGSY
MLMWVSLSLILQSDFVQEASWWEARSPLGFWSSPFAYVLAGGFGSSFGDTL